MSNTNTNVVALSSSTNAVEPRANVTAAAVYRALESFIRLANEGSAKLTEVKELGAKYVIGLWLTEQATLAKLGKTQVVKAKAAKQRRYEQHYKFMAEIKERMAALNDQTQVDSHRKAMSRAIEKLAKEYDGYSAPKSQSDAAVNKAKSRGANANKTSTAKKVSTKKAGAVFSLGNTLKNMGALHESLTGHVPSANIKTIDTAWAAYVATVKTAFETK